MKCIAVHNGRAHVDDFLSACVLLYKIPNSYVYRGFNKQDLEDDCIYVVDQGLRHEPEKLNFDHHQIKEKVCALTLVLDHLYPNIDYRSIIPNIRYAEISDSFGSAVACSDIGLPQDFSDYFNSPIVTALLEIFSGFNGIVAEDFQCLMRDIGRHVCRRIESYEEKMIHLQKAKFFDVNGLLILDTTECTYERPDLLPTKEYSKKLGLHPDAIFTKDMRGGGYRLISTDTNRLVFTNCEKTTFVHQSGFLAVFPNKNDITEVLENANKTPKLH